MSLDGLAFRLTSAARISPIKRSVAEADDKAAIVPNIACKSADDAVCPICRAGRFRRLYSKNGRDIARCSHCGVGRTEEADFDPASYYTAAYFEGGHHDGYADYGESAEVLAEEFGKALTRLLAVAPTGGSLLEIGCAYGYFLKLAAQHWKVHGLEISADAVAQCQAQGLTSVRRGAADHSALSQLEPLQAVVMLDVIEHLADPVGVLADCRDKLAPGGVLMLSTGDFASPLARLMGRNWRLMTPPQHLWFFTPAGFRALAQSQGWEVVQLTHPGKRVPLSLIDYQLRRILRLQPRSLPGWARVGIPLNLHDAMLLVLRKPA